MTLTAALICLGMGHAAQAQDETAPETAPETEAPAESPAPIADGAAAEGAAGADAADAAAATEPPAVEIITTTYDDWDVRCTNDSSNCDMYQLVRDEALNPVVEVSIQALPAGGQAVAGATIVTPLGTLLSEGALLQIDSGRARQYPFNWCDRGGCYARFGLTAEEVANMKRGVTAKLRILSVSAPETPVLLDISLAGFTAAFDSMPR